MRPHTGQKRNAYTDLAGKPEEKRMLGRRENIKMDLKDTDGGVWSRFIWLRISVRSLQKPSTILVLTKCMRFLG
jgi:hypothetical protein